MRFLAGPGAGGARDAIRAILELGTERARMAGAPDPQFVGLALATSSAGHKLNTILSRIEHFTRLSAAHRAPDSAPLQDGDLEIAQAAVATMQGTMGRANRDLRWMHLGPRLSADLLREWRHPADHGKDLLYRQLRRQYRPDQIGYPSGKEHMESQLLEASSQAVATLLHEIEHGVTHPRLSYLTYRDVEEAIAATLTHWPGALANAARRLNMRYEPSHAGGMSYYKHVRTMQALLRAAGIDSRRRDSLPAATQLLQGASVTSAPRRIAERIVAHQGLDPSVTRDLTRRIHHAIGRPSATRQLIRDYDLPVTVRDPVRDSVLRWRRKHRDASLSPPRSLIPA